MSTIEVNAPTVKFRRLATAACFASLFAYAVLLTITPAAINQIGGFYHAGESRLGILFLAMMAGFTVTVLLAGSYSDRHGKLPAITAGCVVMTAGVALFGVTGNFTVALVAMLLMGVGGGLSECSSTAMISDLFTGPSRTSMMNLSQVAFGVGAVATPLAVGRLIEKNVDWRMGYAGAAVICVICSIICVFALARREEKPLGVHEDNHNWRSLLGHGVVLWSAIGIFLYVGAECGQANWLAKYFKTDLHATGALAAKSGACFWLGITVGRFVGAWLSHKMSEVAMTRVALALAAISQAGLLLLYSPGIGLYATFILGTCLGPVFPTIVSYAGAAYPRQSGTVTAIVIACGSLGGAVFPPTIGGLAGSIGMRYALWTCFAVSSVNLVIFLKMRQKGSQRAES